MSDYFITDTEQPVVPIVPLIKSKYPEWLAKQSSKIKNWLQANKFNADSGSYCLIANKDGALKEVFLGLDTEDDFWAFGALPPVLPEGCYKLKNYGNSEQLRRAAIAWGLGSYQFAVYKKPKHATTKLLVDANNGLDYINNVVSSITFARDLINYPAENMGPASLAKAITSLGIEFDGTVKQTIGDDLEQANFNAIYAVGKGSSCKSRLLDLTWGDSKHPKVTLVGKGVCFDSGGLDIKTSHGMLEMKKDMTGAAYALSLARMIMTAELPIRLRVLIPAVENMVSGNSYKPRDVIKTYSGLTVEVMNTDAEGRLILADALALASEDEPDLVMDFA